MCLSPFGSKDKTKKDLSSGITVIEILIVVFVIGVGLSALFGVVSLGLKVASISDQTIRAVSLSRESMEAVRSFRDTTAWNVDGLGILSTASSYHPQLSGSPSRWQLVSGQESTGIFTREIIIEEVRRDASSGNIVPSGGSVDLNTLKIRSLVSWQERGRTKQVKAASYITNWR